MSAAWRVVSTAWLSEAGNAAWEAGSTAWLGEVDKATRTGSRSSLSVSATAAWLFVVPFLEVSGARLRLVGHEAILVHTAPSFVIDWLPRSEWHVGIALASI